VPIVNAATDVTVPVGILGNVCNAPEPSMYCDAMPAAVIASVPDVVIGEPVTLNAAGVVSATLVTVPPLTVVNSTSPVPALLSVNTCPTVATESLTFGVTNRAELGSNDNDVVFDALESVAAIAAFVVSTMTCV
jgi:hypothetical protein